MYTKKEITKHLKILNTCINTSFVTDRQAESSFLIIQSYIREIEEKLEQHPKVILAGHA